MDEEQRQESLNDIMEVLFVSSLPGFCLSRMMSGVTKGELKVSSRIGTTNDYATGHTTGE